MALLEAAEYINIKIKNAGFNSVLTKNYIDQSSTNVVVCGHLIPDKLLNLNCKMIIFNSEQLPENSEWTSAKYRALLDKNYVWDYSLSNLDKISHKNTGLIDFYYCSELNRIKIKKPASYDLLFYGSINERRKKILDKIIASGLRVKISFGVYGEERDALISESRAVLNLHYYESQIFQQIRTFYPLINNIPVISENYPFNSAPSVYQEAIFLNGNTLVEKYVSEILSNPNFESIVDKKLAEFKKTEASFQFKSLLNKYLDCPWIAS
jgi:hypothetical protein